MVGFSPITQSMLQQNSEFNSSHESYCTECIKMAGEGVGGVGGGGGT